MMSATATAHVQRTARCQHPLGCTNRVSVAPHCPVHGGWSQLLATLAAIPVCSSSAEWAAARNEFLRERARA